MSFEEYKKTDTVNDLKVYSSGNILIYHRDKLRNIAYQYYKGGQLKTIKYWDDNIFIVHNEKGESVSNKSKQDDIHKFVGKNYLEINSEDDDSIREFTFSWIKELIKSDKKKVIIVLNDLIRTDKVGMKTHAIQFAALNYLSDCLETISLELNNKTKTDVYRGPRWDDYEIQEIFTADTFFELAEKAIEMIKTKHNK